MKRWVILLRSVQSRPGKDFELIAEVTGQTLERLNLAPSEVG